MTLCFSCRLWLACFGTGKGVAEIFAVVGSYVHTGQVIMLILTFLLEANEPSSDVLEGASCCRSRRPEVAHLYPVEGKRGLADGHRCATSVGRETVVGGQGGTGPRHRACGRGGGGCPAGWGLLAGCFVLWAV